MKSFFVRLVLCFSIILSGIAPATRAQICSVISVNQRYLCWGDTAEVELEHITFNSNSSQYTATFEALNNPSYRPNITIAVGPNNQTTFTKYNLTCPLFLGTDYGFEIVLSTNIPSIYTCTSPHFNVTRCGNGANDFGEPCDPTSPGIGGEACDLVCQCSPNTTSFRKHCIHIDGTTKLSLNLNINNGEMLNVSLGVDNIILDLTKTVKIGTGTNIRSKANVYLNGHIIFDADTINVGKIYPIFTSKQLLIYNTINITNLGPGFCAKHDLRGLLIDNETITELIIDVYLCNSTTLRVNGTCDLKIKSNTTYVCPLIGYKNISLEWNDAFVPDIINGTKASNISTYRFFYQYDTLPPIYIGEVEPWNSTFLSIGCTNKTEKHSLVLTVSGVANFFCKSVFYFTVCGNGVINIEEECDYGSIDSLSCGLDCKCLFGLSNSTGMCLLPPVGIPSEGITNNTNSSNPNLDKITALTYAIIVMTAASVVMTLGILGFICKYRSKT